MTTKDKLLHLAAQIDQHRRELLALAGPINQGGATDISFAASHTLGVAASLMSSTSAILTQVAGRVSR